MKQWFKNLKKWQQGALIGCGVGLLFTCLLMLSLILEQHLDSREAAAFEWWLMKLHALPYLIFFLFLLPISIHLSEIMAHLLTSGAILICYGGLGALVGDIVGRIQRVPDPSNRRLLTGLLAFFLLFIYWCNFQVGTWLEQLH